MNKIKDILTNIKLVIGLIIALITVIGIASTFKIQLADALRDIELLQEANLERKDEVKTVKSIVVGIIWKMGKSEEEYKEWLIDLTQ